MTEYKTITKLSEGLFKDRGSKFLAYAYPITTVEDVKKCVDLLKEPHPKARHFCFAYRLGLDNNNFRANDDGEPSGSAGKPILGQIDSFGLTNTLVIVVRYFGGTKLGVPGLINAYRLSTQEALENAGTITKQLQVFYQLKFGYNMVNEVMNFVKRNHLEITEQVFEADCMLKLAINLKDEELFLNWVSKLHLVEFEKIG